MHGELPPRSQLDVAGGPSNDSSSTGHSSTGSAGSAASGPASGPATALPGPAGPSPDPRAGGARRSRRRRDAASIADDLRADPELRDRFVRFERLPARPGLMEAFPQGLDPLLVEAFKRRGHRELYSHQAEAIRLALAGEDVLVTTATASGKTLAYTAPVLQSLIDTDGAARSLWLFPTKALSQDQSASLNGWIEELGGAWHSYTYDGDTPPSVRRTLRERGHVILTNPWMLHQGILPNHAKWADLFAGLHYVVIDEVHTLSGVFGSHVANTLRRLLRIARHYGAEPKFLLSSATLRDPAAHGEGLIGRVPRVVDCDGSPRGERIFALHNPPMLNPVAGLRANALEEARALSRHVCGPGHQTIFFCNRRTSVEVLTRYIKEAAPRLGLKPDEVRGYRGGYLPLLRREVESGLKSGAVKVVVTTNALELGIDVGSLDVAVLVGYPGSQASFWQRAGRVGRRGETSLVVMIARSDPVDQYLVSHPDYLFEAPRESLGLDPDNLVILSEQLKCAAFELPFHREAPEHGEDQPASKGEAEGESVGAVRDFGSSPHVDGILDYLAQEAGFLHGSGDSWYWMADAYPAQDVSLAGNEPDNVVIFDAESGDAIGEVDREGSITSVHEGAIYQVEGETWKVERFDYENRRATARRVESDYFTDAQTDVEVRVLRLEERSSRPRRGKVGTTSRLPEEEVEFESGESGRGSTEPPGPGLAGDVDRSEDYSVWTGEVHVTTVPTLYKKIRFYTRENVGAEDIHLPAEELDTEAFCLTLSEESASDLFLHSGDRGAAWHGLGELLRRVAPLFLRCQSADLGLSAQIKSSHFGRPTLFLYDRVQGGVGLSRLLYRDHRLLFEAARDVIEACDCVRGCPACLGPVEEIGAAGVETARALLDHFLSGAQLAATLCADSEEEPQ